MAVKMVCDCCRKQLNEIIDEFLLCFAKPKGRWKSKFVHPYDLCAECCDKIFPEKINFAPEEEQPIKQ